MSNGSSGGREGNWRVFQGSYEGSPMVLRIDETYRRGRPPAEYPYQVGVTVPFNDASADGLPGEGDMADLELAEEVVASEQRSLLVAVITTQGMREFVLYAAQTGWIEAWAEQLDAQVADHDVQVIAQDDPGWETYHQLMAGTG